MDVSKVLKGVSRVSEDCFILSRFKGYFKEISKEFYASFRSFDCVSWLFCFFQFVSKKLQGVFGRLFQRSQ